MIFSLSGKLKALDAEISKMRIAAPGKIGFTERAPLDNVE
jgi:hypothetical protein